MSKNMLVSCDSSHGRFQMITTHMNRECKTQHLGIQVWECHSKNL